MAPVPFLQKPSGSAVYWFRRRVPDDLKPVLGKSEIRISLKTRDHQEAKRLVRIETVKSDTLFESARLKLNAPLSDDEIDRLTIYWWNNWGRYHCIEFANIADSTSSEDIIKSALKISANNNLKPDDSIRLVESCLEKWKVQFDNLELSPKLALIYPQKSISINDLLNKWIHERKPSRASLVDNESVVRRFVDFAGDKKVKEITKNDIRDFKDLLFKVPARVPRYIREKSLTEIIEIYEGKDYETLSPKTVRKQIVGVLGSLLKWGKSNGYLDSNPVEEIQIVVPKIIGRYPYSDDDINKIFSMGIFKNSKRDNAIFWVPVLALWTGARLNEICQSSIDDIKFDTDIPYIHIHDMEEGRRLKTFSSTRVIPLHNRIMELGFIDYVKGIKDGKLFPDLKANKDGNLAAALSQKFIRQSRKVIPEKRKTFHSFRHSFIDECRNQGVPESVRYRLTGHTMNDVGSGYGEGYGIAALYENIQKLKFNSFPLA